MDKTLKDEITDILDKSGLVDIHLAQGLIIQPIIEIIEQCEMKARVEVHEHYIGQELVSFADEETLIELKKGLKK